MSSCPTRVRQTLCPAPPGVVTRSPLSTSGYAFSRPVCPTFGHRVDPSAILSEPVRAQGRHSAGLAPQRRSCLKAQDHHDNPKTHLAVERFRFPRNSGLLPSGTTLRQQHGTRVQADPTTLPFGPCGIANPRLLLHSHGLRGDKPNSLPGCHRAWPRKSSRAGRLLTAPVRVCGRSQRSGNMTNRHEPASGPISVWKRRPQNVWLRHVHANRGPVRAQSESTHQTPFDGGPEKDMFGLTRPGCPGPSRPIR